MHFAYCWLLQRIYELPNNALISTSYDDKQDKTEILIDMKKIYTDKESRLHKLIYAMYTQMQKNVIILMFFFLSEGG